MLIFFSSFIDSKQLLRKCFKVITFSANLSEMVWLYNDGISYTSGVFDVDAISLVLVSPSWLADMSLSLSLD